MKRLLALAASPLTLADSSTTAATIAPETDCVTVTVFAASAFVARALSQQPPHEGVREQLLR